MTKIKTRYPSTVIFLPTNKYFGPYQRIQISSFYLCGTLRPFFIPETVGLLLVYGYDVFLNLVNTEGTVNRYLKDFFSPTEIIPPTKELSRNGMRKVYRIKGLIRSHEDF